MSVFFFLAFILNSFITILGTNKKWHLKGLTIESSIKTLGTAVQTFKSEIFEKLSKAGKASTNDLCGQMLVTEMNALKRKCDEKEGHVEVLKKRAKELTEQKHNYNI